LRTTGMLLELRYGKFDRMAITISGNGLLWLRNIFQVHGNSSNMGILPSTSKIRTPHIVIAYSILV